jgi:hypothetical protein
MVLAGAAWTLAGVPMGAALAIGLTYVDADNGENFAPNLSPSSAIATAAEPSDNLWGQRSDGGASAPDAPFHSVFEAGGGTAGENVPQIVQTISNLTPNAFYDVYVAYWQGAAAESNWNVRAGFSAGNLKLFNARGPNATFSTAIAGTNAYYFDWEPTAVPTNPDDVTPLLVEAQRKLLLGHVGAATSAGSGQITVFVDDLPTSVGGPNADPSNARTWFDGLAYVPAGTDVFIAPGDFNDDLSIDAADAHIFLVSLHTDVSQFTVLEAYRVGDLNADQIVDHGDFASFKRLYTTASGNGSGGELTLEVLVDGSEAGAVRVRNKSGLTAKLDYYEITSAAGSLIPTGWMSLDDLEGDDAETSGWDEVPASDVDLISELNLQSSTMMAPGFVVDLGQSFQAGSARDLQFYYGLPDGTLQRGVVQYISELLVGDYNDNGTVDAADYAVWRKTLNQNVPNGTGADGDGNGIVQQADYLLWRANFGLVGSTGAAIGGLTVPEARSLGLAACGLLMLSGCKLTRAKRQGLARGSSRALSGKFLAR